MFTQHFEQLAAWATAKDFAEELACARERFFQENGEVHEDDPSFEVRMSALSEYTLFDHLLGGGPEGRRVVECFLDEQGEVLTTEQRSIFRGMSRTRNGLFEVRKLRETDIRVRDLLSGEDLEVHERRRLTGVLKGDLVQTRLVPFKEHLVFGRAFLYHPREVRKAIVRGAKVRRKAGAFEAQADRRRFLGLLSRTLLALERQRAKNLAPPDVGQLYGQALE